MIHSLPDVECELSECCRSWEWRAILCWQSFPVFLDLCSECLLRSFAHVSWCLAWLSRLVGPSNNLSARLFLCEVPSRQQNAMDLMDLSKQILAWVWKCQTSTSVLVASVQMQWPTVVVLNVFVSCGQVSGSWGDGPPACPLLIFWVSLDHDTDKQIPKCCKPASRWCLGQESQSGTQFSSTFPNTVALPGRGLAAARDTPPCSPWLL